jgi:hypothetical protein
MPRPKKLEWCGNKVDFCHAGEMLGKSRSYFWSMAKHTPSLFFYIQTLHHDPVHAVKLYEEECLAASERLKEIYYECLEARRLAEFSRYLHEKGIYGHPGSFSSVFQYKFAARRTNLSALQRYKKVAAAFEEWRRVL